MKTGPLATGLFAALVSLGTATIAHAQATRTWVSGDGDDANPCSRTAPCLTFQGAYLKTAHPGVISVREPGDYGDLVIDKSVIIDGAAVGGDVAPVTATGIRVAAGPTDNVVLRSISLVGSGMGSGIRYESGRSLTIDGCHVSNFTNAIDVQLTTAGSLVVLDSTAIGNVGAGLRAESSNGGLLGSIARSQFDGNGFGIFAAGGARLSVYESTASQNGTGITAATEMAGALADVNLEGVTIASNDVGIAASSTAGNAVVRMSKVVGMSNTTDTTTTAGNAEIFSFGNNRFDEIASITAATIALSTDTPSNTVAVGESATYPVVATMRGILVSPVAFACSGLPAGFTCQFDPETLPGESPTGTVNVTVVPTVASKTGLLLGPGHGLGNTRGSGDSHPTWPFPTFAFAVPALALFGARRKLRVPLACLALVSFTATTACGSSSDDANTNDDTTSLPDGAAGDNDGSAPGRDGSAPDGGTDAGGPQTYSFKVTATSGVTNASLDLSLTVE
ncbi:hypothetical protein AKJ09_03815 [Labilithrix luteola]|uniref:Right handed beta helix domain-containing protein n=1 Tax=Labilithrix luteola TaxID=1391654 RepID=A0A0K1PUU6_9BACT|nr:right-handed parallel beta-helix repeat-containing protein [Labilithrix luteola]AKU97151.1 hypothetical protein AKJ09_03815 [Labilithrix luteola]